MAKIIHFKSQKEKAKEWIEDCINQNINKAKSIAILIDNGNDEVLTAYWNADMFEKLY